VKRRRVLAAIAVAVAVAAFVWSRDEAPVGAPASPPYVTIFMVDGLSRSVFAEELAAGNLPNVQRLIDDGIYVERGVSSFPSMTGYGFWPLQTGEDAVVSGVLGLRWLDRERAQGNFRSYVGSTNVEMNLDLVPEPKTVFERFGDAHSMTINSYNNRGAVHSVKTGFKFTAAKYEGHWWVADLLEAIPVFEEELSPTWEEVERYAVDLLVADLANGPKVQWVTFVSPDTYAHVNGLGPEYPGLVRMVDGMVGRYREAAAARGVDDDRIYLFVSDHGVESLDRNVQLVDELGARGVRAWRGEATVLLSTGALDTLQAFAEYDVVMAINGNLMSYLYVRSPSGWATAPTLQDMRSYAGKDLVAELLEIEGIEHVIARDGADVRVFASDGVATIATSSTGFRYRFEGEDPFGYAADERAAPLVGGGFHDARAWIEATAETPFPYGTVRVARLMAQPGAGDLVVTSAPGYDLAKDYEMFVGNYRGGHGGLRADQILVPYVIAGPGVPKARRFGTAAVEDVGATLLEALGEAPAAVAGRSLLR
jgi:hypothetical protein